MPVRDDGTAAVPEPLSALLASLDLAPTDRDRFTATSVERTRPRMFGGELLAQAVVAACRTAEDRACHALHANFLSPGDPSRPVEYQVRRLRDGRRFAQRQVTAWQGEREIMLATVSFAAESAEPLVYQHEAMPAVPEPEALRTELEHRLEVAGRLREEEQRWLLSPRAIDIRPVRPMPLVDPPLTAPVADTWMRAIGRLPDDPNLHRAVLAYASDMTLLDIACYPHGLSWADPGVEQASLDHAMWFHRPFRADAWWLYAQAAPIQAAGRALARGSVFTRDGALVASVAQEGLSRIRRGD